MKYDFPLELDTANSLSIILSRVKPGSTILEFGPANGRLTKHLTEVMQCEVYCVEIDKSAADDASKYAKDIIIGDIEQYEWATQFSTIKFDYIVYADVLEHLYDPEKVLKISKNLLSSNGSILISIPNIAHNAIIMELFKERFTYRPTGLLDNTHIRFFSRHSLDKAIESSGLHKSYETYVRKSPQETEFDTNYNQFPDKFADSLKNRMHGEAYQFIYELQASPVTCMSDFPLPTMTLFFDKGKGFNDMDSTPVFYDPALKVFHYYPGSAITDIHALRIDPTEYPIEINISSFTINGDDMLKLLTSNSSTTESNRHFFLHDDPQLQISFPNPISLTSISMGIENLLPIENAKIQIIEHLEQDRVELLKKIESSKSKISTQEKCIIKKQTELEEALTSTKKQELLIDQLNNDISTLLKRVESMRIRNRIKALLRLKV